MPHFLLRLRFLIPILVFSVTLALVVVLTLDRMREGERDILRSMLESAHSQMTQLQDILSDSLVKGDREQARQRFSYAALSPQIVTLILIDADGTILIANRQECINANAATCVPHYDRQRAEKAVSLQQGSLAVADRHHIRGYYPITLGLRTGEIRPQRSATLFVDYDFSDRFAMLRHEAYSSAAKLCTLLCLFALALSFLLHLLITKPVDRLVRAAKEIARGNLKIRAGVSGMDEFGQLGRAFDEMAEHLATYQNDLHEQNVLLEGEIAERQTAQESLEEQAQLLEEEIAERRQAEEKLRIIFDTTQVGIILVDAAGVITFANRCVSLLYGIEPTEMMGTTYVEHVHPDEREASEQLLRRLIRGDIDSISVERHYLRNNGGDFWGFLNAKRHLDDKDRLLSIIIVITDVTELRAAQAERDVLQKKFNQAQKMEAIGRLAGGVAHDFNNKLSVIMGYAELLTMTATTLDEEQRGRLDEILKAARHSSEITRQLLAFSRSEVIQPQKVNLNRILDDSRKSLGRLIGEDIHLEFKPEPDLWPTLLDPTQIDQIIMNLAVNSRDAMPEGGVFGIATANVHVDDSYVLTTPGAHEGDYVQLVVSDSGSGMDAATLEHLFEPFFTTKETGKGTGLGLATIYGIVSQNNGFITVYSEAGYGATFKIYFPRMTEYTAALAAKEAEASISGTGTVLLVEDEEPLRKVGTDMLRQLGYGVLEAKSPLDALELCRSDAIDTVDLILTDVIMPDMNGKEMCDRILKMRPDIPVLFMSGYTVDFIASKGVLQESVHFIQKPFNLQQLSMALKEVMG